MKKISTTHSSLSAVHSRGQLTIQILIIGFVTMVLLSGFVLWADTYVRGISRSQNNAQAFAIAESGIEYYRWHLSHAKNDYTDGATSTPPYVHPYYDKDGKRLGQFELTITPPPTGSTIVTVQSVGKVDADSTVKRTIIARLGIPFIGQYAVLANGNIQFPVGTTVTGMVHSNGGVHFDGVAYNIVESAKATYNDPDHSGGDEYGVHTHVSPTDPAPPTALSVRTDIFKAGRQFPVPAIDFSAFTKNLASLKSQAQANGYYKGKSGAKGYDLVLNPNGYFNLYKVTALTPISKECKGNDKKLGTWSIKTETFVASSTIPANQIIFIEDNLWVRGQVSSTRVTIAAGRFPAKKKTYSNIILNHDLLYSNLDGKDVIGLIAQGDVKIGLEADDTMTVDAALVAQNGATAKQYYSDKCGAAYQRTKLTLYGMIATNAAYGFAFTDGSGYATRIITYDNNLLYAPPPGFPTIGNIYKTFSWQEVK